jgi:hypothetical protein
MDVIIFSIDKNYEACRELKNGVGDFKKSLLKLKNPPYPLGKGDSAELNSKHLPVTQKSYSIVNSF